MSFVDLTLDVDKSLITLGVVKPPKKLKVAQNVKVETEYLFNIDMDLNNSQPAFTSSNHQ